MPATDRTLDLRADLDLIRDAAAQAGEIALGFFRKNPEVWWKAGSSPVSEADFAVDRFLRETLSAARPDYGWLSEETADNRQRLSARRIFVVDPIDGTRGFLEGLDQWCISIAVVEGGVSLAGVLDCPARRQVFLATEGGGSTLNGTPLAVREAGERLIVGGPKSLLDRLPPAWTSRFERVAHIPSLALRIARIAEGTLDASFVKPNAHDWDLAAADLILREAGGAVLDRHGRHPRYATDTIQHNVLVAGSGAVLDAMLASVHGQGA